MSKKDILKRIQETNETNKDNPDMAYLYGGIIFFVIIVLIAFVLL